MKKIIIVLFCFFPAYGISQTFKPLDSLSRIKFGSSRKAVIADIKAIGGIWDTGHSDPQFFVFAGVKFDNHVKSLFAVKFISGTAYETDYVILTSSGVNTITYYDELVKKLNDAYGTGSLTRNIKPPYKHGDGNELRAIKEGLAEYSAFWPVDGKTIILSIGTDLNTTLTIQDDALAKQAIAKQKAEK